MVIEETLYGCFLWGELAFLLLARYTVCIVAFSEAIQFYWYLHVAAHGCFLWSELVLLFLHIMHGRTG
jgi:hypothetical protein